MQDYHIKDPWGNSKNSEEIKCNECGFDQNKENSSICEVCHQSLIEKTKVDNLQLVKTVFQNSTSRKSRRSKKSRQYRKTAKKIWLSLVKLEKGARVNLLFFSPSAVKKLKKPSNLIGIVVLGFGVSLWANYLLTNSSTEQAKIEQNQEENKSLSTSVASSSPQGLFSYGGAPFYAPLSSNGLISSLESDNPGLEYRFAKPLNEDYSNTNGIKMLIEQEISVAFNGRSLTDAEFARAEKRGFQLLQSRIGLDGVVFFGNNDSPVSSLSEKQIRDIFTGKITNWNQISQDAEDLPITPIILENEDLSTFGIELAEIPPTAEFIPNHTQAVRKVIATPGSITFSSASLAQGQQLIQSFDIAEGNSKAYIPGLIDGVPNLTAFRDESYPFTRNIFLSYRVDGSPEEEAAKIMKNCLNAEKGQTIIKKAGLVPLRSL